MLPSCSVTVLSDNSVRARNLIAEHGLALWIAFGEHRFLLDTGQGFVLRHNAAQLGIDLATADGILLSHGHYDHTGELGKLLSELACPVYAHPVAFHPRFACDGYGNCRSVGVAGGETMGAVLADRLHPVCAPTEVVPGLWLTGPVPRTCEFEQEETPFFLDSVGCVPDPLVDDQSVFYRTEAGTIVLLGCAHSGVVNTLRYVQHLTGNAPIHTVVGGMHLGSASASRIAQTVAAFLEMGIARVAPMHCTGVAASHSFRAMFGGSCLPCPVGTILDLADPLPASVPVRGLVEHQPVQAEVADRLTELAEVHGLANVAVRS